MNALPTQAFEPGFDRFIQEEVTLISTLNDARIHQMMDYAKNFLDEIFPLAYGSHKQVKSYVVYYQNLLTFFEDGTQSGLLNPKQFVALSGPKYKPESLVFRNDEGFHAEIIFNSCGKRGRIDQANIDDIQVQTNGGSFGDIILAANDEDDSSCQHWFSMIRGDTQIITTTSGHKVCQCIDTNKEFTAKDGDSYFIGN